MSRWDDVLDDAMKALVSGNLEAFQLPEDVVPKDPVTAAKLRMSILVTAFERWLKSEWLPR
ncbi:hypothetical protein [Sphaerisporangium rhizosphaerae]|uniref:Uncharacterized protein n=1 Tax=Sphaerisporangium rhizosphaerae TaxID=2269375 RepID=A0ABW2NX84_9ACTN